MSILSMLKSFIGIEEHVSRRASAMRKKAAKRYNVPVSEFPWALCMCLAAGKDINDIPWVEQL